ncbi:MAG TPA: DnaJ C-terminal domain-containing protein, partial [Chitinophagaceae bacterium]|nr:DnaJ C-terminal domain-containing protein [Chitinophagaceae bacterium]
DVYATHNEILNIDGKNVRITIPAGIEDGQVIKLRGYGGAGLNGGVPGDLYVNFSVINNTSFRLSGNDLHAVLEIDLYTAVLGGEVTVGVMDGKVKLKINAGMQSGTKVRLKGKGMPVYKQEGAFGDLYITLQVKLPVDLTEKQKELFRKLAKM